MDKVSVVIPIYNVETYIRQCLDSIVCQTYSNLEIILVDDCSPDRCGEICEEYAAKDDRIIVIHIKKNAGVSAARNVGMKIATGKWLAFVDPDDWCEPDYYEKLMHAIGDRELDIFCTGGGYWEYADHNIVKTYVKQNFVIKRETKNTEWEKLSGRVIAAKIDLSFLKMDYAGGYCWDKIYNVDFVRRWNIQFDTELHPMEDVLLNYILFDLAEAVAGCTYVGYHYRQTNVLSVTKKYQKNFVDVLCAYLEKINTYKLCSGDKEAIEKAKNVNALCGFRNCLRRYFLHKENHKPYMAISEEIGKLKCNRYMQKAIWNRSNQYFPKRVLILKWMLRIPGVWPVRLFYLLDRLCPQRN